MLGKTFDIHSCRPTDCTRTLFSQLNLLKNQCFGSEEYLDSITNGKVLATINGNG